MKQIVKKINFLKILEVLLASLVILAPVVSVAQGLGQTFGCNSALQNCGATSVNGLLHTIIDWLLGIAFGIAVLFLIVGGFWYITSAGNEETAEKGKNTAINAIIGIVIIILSYVIINVVSNLVSTSGGTGAP